jgi:hypothetical protein
MVSIPFFGGFGAVPRPADFFRFSVARSAGQGWLWHALGSGRNVTAAWWDAKRAGIEWDRSEFFKDAYRMSRQQRAIRETRDLPGDRIVPRPMQIETIFDNDQLYRARVKFYGRDAETGRFARYYREFYYNQDMSPDEILAMATDSADAGYLETLRKLGESWKATLEFVQVNVRR